MRKKPWFVYALGISALILIGIYLAMHLEWVPTTQRSGLSREARENPYLAGMLMLRRLGYSADVIRTPRSLHALSPQATLLITSNEPFNDPVLRSDLLHWVAQGGHLVLPITVADAGDNLLGNLGIDIVGQLTPSGAAPFRLELERQVFTLSPFYAPVFSARDKSRFDWSVSLSGKLADKPSRRNRGPRAFTPASRTSSAEFPEPLPPGRQIQNPDGQLITVSLYARLHYKDGWITVGDLRGFQFTSLGEDDRAPLFVRLTTLPDDARPIHVLLFRDSPGLFTWLATHAAEALMGFGLLIAAALWRNIPRFGPLLPEAPAVRPGLTEHLTASGNFLLRHRAYKALVTPLREDVQRRLEQLQHRYPDIERPEQLAARLSGLGTAEIAHALAFTPGTHREFLRGCRTLITVRRHCKNLQHSSSVSGVTS